MEMSMKSRKELSEVVARRYRKARKKGKGRILDEFVAATGYNRAYAAMLLRNYERDRRVAAGANSVKIVTTKVRRRAGGRPAVYGPEVRRAVERLWKQFGHVCGKRLVVIIRASLPFISAHPRLKISLRTCRALQTISAATVDRLLAPARKRLFLKGLPHTRPVSGLAAQIPVRTFSEWRDVGPGHLQLDLVGHDGGIASGEFCFTLSATDVCTGWTERRAILTKAARWVTEALEQMQSAFAFPVMEIHPDNGSEFINRNLTSYCAEHHIRMTRSRAGRKNDNCYVEQKNFDTVRKLVGYYRYCGEQAVGALNELYLTHGLLLNYVYPSQKLLRTDRHGSVVRKTHDAPRPPADRLLARDDIDGRCRWQIAAVRQSLDPLELSVHIGRLQRAIISHASRLSHTSASQGATA
jgi:hypothetical protein